MGRVGLGVAVGCAVVASGIAAVAVWRRVKSRRGWARAVSVLKEFEEGCATPVSRLRQVVDAMAVEMHAGLASDGGSKLRMLLTFVDALPNGNEKGTYYALHLGGAYFRVLKVELGGARSTIMKHQDEYQLIPQDLVTSTTEGLFDFLAMTLKRFVEKDDKGSGQSADKIKELGFTFPFPLKQLSISSGTLVKWTKEFAIEDANGKDVAQCLHEALIKSDLEMQVAALVNDTVGTLALGHYEDEDTVAAVIIGTGTNACYVERTDSIIKCQGLLTNSDEMVINMEWGNFWSSHLPRTPYDFDLDGDSPNQYDQGFEKMISGMYLGDIVRRVLLRMSQQSDIFGESAHHLSTPFILSTPLMASMHEDDTPDLKVVERILVDELKLPNVSLKARRLVVRVCNVVTQRAARLAAAGIVGILKKIGRDGSGGVASGRVRGKPKRTVVAIEGALYVSYSSFREYLNEAMAEILGEEVAPNVVLRVTEDGSGVGAALLAASHSLLR